MRPERPPSEAWWRRIPALSAVARMPLARARPSLRRQATAVWTRERHWAASNSARGQRLLDLGCGPGGLMERLAPDLGGAPIGVDVNQELLRAAPPGGRARRRGPAPVSRGCLRLRPHPAGAPPCACEGAADSGGGTGAQNGGSCARSTSTRRRPPSIPAPLAPLRRRCGPPVRRGGDPGVGALPDCSAPGSSTSRRSACRLDDLPPFRGTMCPGPPVPCPPPAAGGRLPLAERRTRLRSGEGWLARRKPERCGSRALAHELSCRYVIPLLDLAEAEGRTAAPQRLALAAGHCQLAELRDRSDWVSLRFGEALLDWLGADARPRSPWPRAVTRAVFSPHAPGGMYPVLRAFGSPRVG